MNAGRDVERLIAGWLVDEAADRAPDRILESTRRSIDRTPQRRWSAAWREPMFVSPFRMAALTAGFLVAVIGAAYVGRATSPTGPGGIASPPVTTTASPSPSGPSLESFRVARDAICARYAPLINPLKTTMEGIYDPELTPAERAPKVDAMRQTRTEFNRLIGELRELHVPAEIAVDNAVVLTAQDSTNHLIAQAIDRLDAGDLAGAEALDLATDPNSRQIEAFERRYELQPCP